MEEKTLNNKRPVIITHSGTFHADDCFAVATLLLHLKKEADEVEIVRTRDLIEPKKGDFVVDVGDVYDESNNRFDHHQEGGAGKREGGIPYATFGLVWKKFGREICNSDEVARLVDVALILPTDAHDNGVSLFQPIFKDAYPYSLDQFVHMSNPTWKENEKDADRKFKETVLVCKNILERTITFFSHEEEASSLVVQEYTNTEDKRIIVLSKDYPWKTILQKFPEPLFVVYPREDGTYGVKAVSDGQFKNRKDFPESWAGKREKLADESGIPDAIFCHNGRFMAVAKSKEGAIALAKLALNS